MIEMRFVAWASLIVGTIAMVAALMMVPEVRCQAGLPVTPAESCFAPPAKEKRTSQPIPSEHTVGTDTVTNTGNIAVVPSSGVPTPAITPPSSVSAPPMPPPLSPPAVPIQLVRLLTDADLAGKDQQELDIMRNEIYARHGRRFNRADLQRFFNGKDWYRGIYAPEEFREEWLPSIERANANFILSYQQSIH